MYISLHHFQVKLDSAIYATAACSFHEPVGCFKVLVLTILFAEWCCSLHYVIFPRTYVYAGFKASSFTSELYL